MISYGRFRAGLQGPDFFSAAIVRVEGVMRDGRFRRTFDWLISVQLKPGVRGFASRVWRFRL